MGCRPVAVVIMHVHKYEIGISREACRSNLESWEPTQHSLLDKGKPRKTCAEVAGRRTFPILTSS
jgi:UDP-2,3-diacylglucosamine pyrophosphatase LpxH